MAQEPLTLKWLFFSFQGRIARRSFALSLVFLIFPQLFVVQQMVQHEGNENVLALLALVLFAVWAAVLWSVMALCAKRLHDLGVTGWLSLIAFIPAVSWIFFLTLMVLPSSQETNEYGSPPFPIDERSSKP